MKYTATVYLDAVLLIDGKECTVRRVPHREQFADLEEAQRFINRHPEPGTVTKADTGISCFFRVGGKELSVVDDREAADE